MFRKVLVANRGEVAVRIIRACKELGIATVAIYSEADKDALHTQIADEAICVGGKKSSESYLNMQNIIQAACNTKCEAIHPGFGFLGENALFADMCEKCNIKFIGPSSHVIDLMGNKANARAKMISAKVPVIPGSNGTVDSVEDAFNFAKKVGYPVMIKACSGGGGKGIRIVRNVTELEHNFNSAKLEAKMAFLDDSVYMEKVIEDARHIEVQVLADEHGEVIHLFERDCSLQRRNQKVIEEAPAFCLSDKKRRDLGKIAVRAAKAVGYTNAGTVEFLYKDDEFYFMEMNTRLQVEHPITEMITNVDIVKEQLKIASGYRLSYRQTDIEINGFAIECRINAEDPSNNFSPSPAKIEFLHCPGGLGVRVDSAIYNGYTIPPFYDSMIMKLIVHGKDRRDAIRKMRRTLDELVIVGPKNNVDFQYKILRTQEYVKGEFNTNSIDKHINKILSNNIK